MPLLSYCPEPLVLAKYFNRTEEGCQINEKIRKLVIFAKHNILKDPPFSKLDLLVCRNLFIYIKSEYQQKILNNFYYAFNRGGYLFLGSNESLGDMNDAFEKIDTKWKIYRFRDSYRPQLGLEMNTHIETNLSLRGSDQDSYSIKSRKNLWFEQMLVEVLRLNLPPSVIVDNKVNILHIIEDVSAFFSLQTGRFSNKLLTLINKELSLYINDLLRRLKNDRKTVRIDNIQYGQNEKKLTIQGFLIEMHEEDYLLISFKYAQVEKNIKSVTINMNQESQERVKQLELEREIHDDKGNTYIAKMRPFRTSNYAIDGIILTLVDITQLKQSQNKLAAFQERHNKTQTIK